MHYLSTNVRYRIKESFLEMSTFSIHLENRHGSEFLCTGCGTVIPLEDVLAVNGIELV